MQSRITTSRRIDHPASGFFEALLDHLPDMVFALSPPAHVLWGNQTFRECFGTNYADLTITEMECGLGVMPGLLQDEIMRAEMPGQSVFTGDTLLEPARENSLPWTFRLIALEEHSCLLAVLRRVPEEASNASYRAELDLRTRNLFMTMLGSELRTPLSVIEEMSSSMLEGLDGDEQEMAEVIHDGASHLLELVSELFEVASAEPALPPLYPRRIPLRLFLQQEILPRFRRLARRKKLSLTFVDEPSVPDVIVTDPLYLKQVLSNLLDNALKFTCRGGVSLIVSWDADNGAEGSGLGLHIADTGRGIPADLQESVFRPLFRIPDYEGDVPEGGGLGLPVALSLVRRMGGDLRLESMPGTGSVFSVLLPAVLPGGAD